MATPNSRRKLEQIERSLDRQWRSLALAEQRGQPAAVLERMYAAYLRTLDAYIVCARAHVGKLDYHKLRPSAAMMDYHQPRPANASPMRHVDYR